MAVIAPPATAALPGRLDLLVDELLRELGEDPQREGLVRTPGRVARSLAFLTSGYRTTEDDEVGEALFALDGGGDMVIVKDIPVYSLCEHHLLPFFGEVQIGYLPTDRVVGLSKIPRLIGMYARRLQIQERLTQDIARALGTVTSATGVAVTIQARHLCMEMRGVAQRGAQTVTTCMLGQFATDPALRAQFYAGVSAATWEPGGERRDGAP